MQDNTWQCKDHLEEDSGGTPSIYLVRTATQQEISSPWPYPYPIIFLNYCAFKPLYKTSSLLPFVITASLILFFISVGEAQHFSFHKCNHNPTARPQHSALPPLRLHLPHQRARQPLPPRHPCNLPLHSRRDSWRVVFFSPKAKAFLKSATKVEQ